MSMYVTQTRSLFNSRARNFSKATMIGLYYLRKKYMKVQERTVFLEGKTRSSWRGPSATELGERSKRKEVQGSRYLDTGQILQLKVDNLIKMPSKRTKYNQVFQMDLQMLTRYYCQLNQPSSTRMRRIFLTL